MCRRVEVLALLVAAIAPAGGNDAPGFRSGSGHTTELLPATGQPVLSLRWSMTLGGGEQMSTPIVGGGRVYVLSRAGTLFCLDPADGALLWSYDVGPNQIGTPAYFKGRLYVPSSDGQFYVLHAQKGDLLWSIAHGTTLVSSPLVAGGVSIGGTPTDVLYLSLGSPLLQLRAYDAKTGAFLWTGSQGYPQVSFSSPAYHAEWNRVIVGDNAGFFHCYDASSGQWLWDYRVGSDILYSAAATEGEYVALSSAGGNNRHVVILKQLANPPYFELHQTVLAVPPASAAEGLVTKVGGTPEGQPDVRAVEHMVPPEILEELRQADADHRTKLFQALEAANPGVDYTRLKERLSWYDLSPSEKNLNKASTQTGVSYINMNYSVETSSPAFNAGRVLVTHREVSGSNTDAFYTVAIGVDPLPANTKVVWGTSSQTFTLGDLRMVASPAVSAATYAYTVRGRELEARNFSDGARVGYLDVGGQILSGPTLADGRVYIGTDAGALYCYDTANSPPSGPRSSSETSSSAWGGGGSPRAIRCAISGG